MFEGEVGSAVEDARVVERGAVFEFVEGDGVVVVRVCEDEVPDEPACSKRC